MAAEPRTLAPPERRIAEVKRVERIGAYDLIVARDPVGPADPQPGQFYMLASGERWGGGDRERPYLPRAFSFARVRRLPGGQGVDLSFLLEDVGPGTQRLGELAAGESLMLLGPLGVGFARPSQDRRPLLVGGGIGVAPILCWDDELRADGVEAAVLLGFRSAGHAAAAALFGGAPDVSTDDGSAGRRALVTEPLRAELERDPHATVYACGPEPMLDAVRGLCANLGVPAQLALEAGMACGYGACFGCVVATVDGYARVCVDGPVFAGEALA
ncbi:MAG TPA: dihydroorotate dehydrogenase electron transfer subunit [Thermoleophilaceae bacterium]|nr:dihydroorotate dehydrogenase electron transfer subunit [Thermoleophilaceae bacterium]